MSLPTSLVEKLNTLGETIELDSAGTGLSAGDVLLYVGRARVTGDITPRDCVIGDDGAAVRILQTLLVIYGYNITIDGVFGAKTKDAVSDFQTKKAVPVNEPGTVGMKTWTKLMEVIA